MGNTFSRLCAKEKGDVGKEGVRKKRHMKD